MTFLPCACRTETSSRCSTPKMSRPAIIAGATLELSDTCCTSSIFTPGQPPASMVRSAIERAPPTVSTPTGWPTTSLHEVLRRVGRAEQEVRVGQAVDRDRVGVGVGDLVDQQRRRRERHLDVAGDHRARGRGAGVERPHLGVDAVFLEEALLLGDVEDHRGEDRRDAGRRDHHLLGLGGGRSRSGERGAERAGQERHASSGHVVPPVCSGCRSEGSSSSSGYFLSSATASRQTV